MKIVLPVHHFPPTYNAGAELYTLRLARRLHALGHQVAVVCVEAIDRGNALELQAEHKSENGIGVWRLSMNLFRSPERTRWDYDNPLLRDWFDQYFALEAPDLVHLQAGYLLGIAPLEAAAAAGIPTVLTLHDYWYLCPRITLLRGDGNLCQTIPDDPAGCAWCSRLSSRGIRIADRASGGLLGSAARSTTLRLESQELARRRAVLEEALAKPQLVIAPSRFLAQRFAPHIAPERLLVARYGLDLAAFQQLQPRPADQTLRIGFIGQVAPHKGVHLLVEAFRQLETHGRSLELHVYGGLDPLPAYVARLRSIAGDDPRVHFHGRVPNTEAPSILKRLDAAVTPSTWYENSPLSIMEAHAAGTPVITAALGGMAELVHDGIDGLHFVANDATDLARKLQRLVDEPELLPRLRAGIGAPRTVDEEVDELLGSYERIMRAYPAARQAPELETPLA